MGLKSLKEIRGNSQPTDSNSSTDGLKSMDDIRSGRFNFDEQQKSLMENYVQMAALNPPSLSTEGVKLTYGANPLDLNSSPIIQKAQQYEEDNPFIGPPAPKHRIPVLDAINENIVFPASEFLNRAAVNVPNFFTGGKHKDILGQSSLFQDSVAPAETTAQKAADIVGSLYGATPAVVGGYATGGRLAASGLARVAPNAGKFATTLVRGAGAGTAYGTAEEALQALRGEEQSLWGRVGDVGMNAALFGAGDAAFAGLGAGVSAARTAATKGMLSAPEKDALDAAIRNFIEKVRTKDLPTQQSGRLVQEVGSGNIASQADELAASFRRNEQQPVNEPKSAIPQVVQTTEQTATALNQARNQRETFPPKATQVPKETTPVPAVRDWLTQEEIDAILAEGKTTNKPIPQDVPAMRTPDQKLPPMRDNYHKPLSNYTDTLYRETNGEHAIDLIPGSNSYRDTSMDDIFFSNKKDLALGQSTNKGVLIEFDAGGLQGQVNTKKPMWDMLYKSGEAEFVGRYNDQKIYQNAVKSVTIFKDAKMDKVSKIRLQRTLSDWEKQANPDGSVTYLRPKQASSVPEVVQPMRTGSSGGVAVRAPQRPRMLLTKDGFIPEGGGTVTAEAQAMRSQPISSRQANPAAVVKKPISRQQLLNNARTRFNVPIRTGRLGVSDKEVLGYYKPNSQVIRSRAHGDIQVISHEIGHHLDNTLGLADPQFDGELMALGRPTSGPKYTRDQIREEGIAEFMRLHLTDPATAKQAAPNFSEFFKGKLDSKTAKAIAKTQQDVANWIDQGPAAQFRGQVNRTGKDANSTVSDKVDKVYSSFVDKLHPLSVTEKAINLLDSGKAKLGDASESLYKKARLFAGTPKKAQLILQDLKKILKPLDKFGYSMKDLGDYAAAKHADELEHAWQLDFKDEVTAALQTKQEKAVRAAMEQAMVTGRQMTVGEIQRIQQSTRLTMNEIRAIKEANRIESGFTREQIQSVLKKFDTPEMNAIQQQLVGYNNKLLDMLVQGEVLSQDAVKAMRAKYKDYVPFYRFFDDDVSSGFGGKGFADLTNPIKRMKGSTRDIIDPLESMIKNTFAVVNAVEKNKVGLELSRLAKVEGSGQFIERLEGAAPVAKENIVTVFEKGERVQFQLEPELYRAINQLDEESSNTLVKFFAYPSSMLRAGATLTPEFMLRNPFRDQFPAYVASNFGYKPIIDLPMGLFHVLKRSDLYKQWVSEGGGYGNMLSQDRNYLREQLKQLKDERNPWAKATVAIVNPKQWLKLLQTMSEFTEEATKVGEFRKGIRKGATPAEAAYQSRDLMDFARVGNSIKQVNRVITFLNANLQGKDRLARAFIEHPIRATTRALTAVTMPAIGVYYWNKHNSTEEQQKTLNNAPQWLRDTFFLISIPGTDVVARIPKPFDLAPVFANLPEQILRWADDNQPQEAGDFAKKAAFDMLKVPYMMAGLTPIIENATNYSFFTGGSIVPRRDQDLLPQDQYGVNTSLTARTVGKVTGTSPYKVDNLIRGYGAGLGKYATAGSDKLLETTGVGSMPPEPEKKISELPVINAFTVDTTGGGRAMEEFYKNLEKSTAVEKSNEKNKIFDPKAKGAADQLQKADQAIKKISTQYRDTQGSYKLSPAEKRKLLDELNDKMNSIAKDSVQKYEILTKR